MSVCPACEESLKKAHESGSTWEMCPDYSCSNMLQSAYTHMFCNCQGPFSGYPYVQNGICMAWGTVVPVMQQQCYCCCHCLGQGMPVAISANEAKSIREFQVNDPVWVARDASLKTWIQKPVSFSSGTGDATSNRFINLHFGDRSTGLHLTPQAFVSEDISQEQAEAYYTILSKAPNNFIGSDGLVNLAMVNTATPGIMAELLLASGTVANRIFSILSTDPNYLMVPRVQPLLMRDGKLKQAEKLVPGKDLLVGKDSNGIPLLSLEEIVQEKGVHHIATSTETASSLDGHLLLANGIVTGDYATLMAMNTPGNPLEDNYRNDPAFGTEAYREANPQLLITPTGAYVKSKKDPAPDQKKN